jgi:hypothetical protein
LIEPVLDETKQLLCLQKPELGIDVYAYQRDELFDALKEEIDVLWRNYAGEKDDILTVGAAQEKFAQCFGGNTLCKRISEK